MSGKSGYAQRAVIVGGGMAGARLAQQLAPVAARVTLIGEEPHAAYNRVLLAEVLAGHYDPGVIRLPAPDPSVQRMSGVRAVRIDRDARRVQCDDGQDVPYDALVLATGSSPVLPPLRGLFEPGGGELPDGVHAFRTMDDCLALADATKKDSRAVVIGGGLLGVSAARALARRGAQVVLAQQGERLMERQLDARAADLLHSHLRELGVEVHTECRVRGLRTGAGRVAEGVELADGYVLDAELVVLACGVRPRTGLARAAGLKIGRGIVVDDELRTSDPAIHAIGDCAEHAGVLYGLAGPALDQADALARLLATATSATSTTRPRYTGTRALTRLTLPRETDTALDLAAFGETEPQPDDDVVHLADATRSVYRKVVVRDDRLVGGILLGDLAAVGTLARAWEGDEPLPDTPLLHLLTDHGGC